MANPESISYIKINDEVHPIDAVTVGEKSASDFQEGNLVTSINSSSTDEEYPSAKCIYDIVYGANGGVVTNNNYIKVTIEQHNYIPNATIDEIGTDYNINNSPEIYVNNTIIDDWNISDNTININLDKIGMTSECLTLSPANYPTNAYIESSSHAGGAD